MVDLDLNGLSAEGESPYLRRGKPIGVRRGHLPRRGRRLLAWAWFGLVAVAPAGWAGYAIARFALGSPRFQLSSPTEVTITGNRFVSRSEILNAIALFNDSETSRGFNLFRAPLGALQKRVESIAWVKSATVMRAFPRRLVIAVTERVPVAFADIRGEIELVDAGGTILDNPGQTAFDFPVLEGLRIDQTPSDRAERVGLYCKFMRETARQVPATGWMISEVRLNDPEDLEALLVHGSETLLLRFGHRDFSSRFQNFLALLPQLEKHSAKIASVDLRYGHQVVVEPAGGESAAPTKSDAPVPGSSGIRD